MMSAQGTTLMERPIDPESLPETIIALEPEMIDRAMQQSRSIQNSDHQWQTYLNFLALAGVEHWFQQRAGDISIHPEPISALHLQLGVCSLIANGFKLCVIATESQPDETIAIPRAEIDLPEFIPHLYVVVAIYEELGQVSVHGLLRYDQLAARIGGVQPDEDWSYPIPLQWFDPDPDRLLLYLRCADPASIALPTVTVPNQSLLASMEAELFDRLPQLQGGDRPWWQVLNWEQGRALLTTPALMDWVFHAQERRWTTQQLSDLLKLLVRPAINVGTWFQEQLDDLAQQLSWVLLPTVSSQMRLKKVDSSSPAEDFEAILTQLQRQGVTLLPNARAAYSNLVVGAVPARLCVVTGMVQTEGHPPEWSLLVIVGPAPGNHLPYGTCLRISDVTGVLVQRSLESSLNDDYLYAEVFGSLDERFLVTITLPEGAVLSLPPFSMQSE